LPTIAIDYTPAYEQGGGIGRYVRELVKALARQHDAYSYRLFVAGVGKKPLPPSPSLQFTWSPTRITPAWLARIWYRAHIPFSVENLVGNVDLYHATDFVLPPTRKTAKTLLTVHDLSFMRVPETASPSLKAYLEDVVPRSARRADHILADSEATRQDLIAYYELDPTKITVLYSGVDSQFQPVTEKTQLKAVRHKYGLGDRPYIFSVGTVQPRKNYGRLIEAASLMRERGIEVDVVIAGGRGWLEDPIYAAIEQYGTSEYVHFIGFAADEDLPALYGGAVCVALPSLYEGFGLPILEAMACGVPVLTSNISSLPEVAGDAALTVTPTDTEAIVAALIRLIEDDQLRDDLIQRGFARARQFTWDASAAQLRGIYQAMLGS
jgi:glycosyltransferase involved in cell wall biosynthesis